MGTITTGHFQTSDALSLTQQVFAQLVSDIDVYNSDPTYAMLVNTYIEEEFTKTSRVIRQSPKEMKKDGEAGDPESQKGSLAEITFTTADYSTASGYTYEYLRDEDPRSLVDENRQALKADADLLSKLFLRACLIRPTTSTTSNTAGFYYGQTDVPSYKSFAHTSAHDHYLTTAAAGAWAAADLTTGAATITHHGYGIGAGQLTFFGNRTTMDEFAALSGFSSELITEQQEADGFIGRLKGVLLRQEDWIPDDYGLLLPTSPARKIAVFKQHEKPAYVGLKIMTDGATSLVNANDLSAIQAARYKRNAIGFDVVLKGAGVAMVKGASWADPTITIN
jgi:hypothetical protein